jgi:citrate lyase subunit beta/citryl-CoA lyase
MFGKDILNQVNDILDFYEIEDIKLHLEDSGALPFVIAARVEAAIKKLIDTEKDFLPEMISENRYQTEKDRNRFSVLYLPGNIPGIMINAGIHKPDGIILDLEDAVAPDKIFEARLMIRNALRQCNFYGAERMVRINQVPNGLDDLNYIVPHNVNLILVPKCEYPEQIHMVNEKIDEIKQEKDVQANIWLMPIIESALGVVNAYHIATAAHNVVAMAIGLEDYTDDIGTKRTVEGTESFFARSQMVVACRAARIQPIDSVFSDIADMEGLKQTVLRSKAMGFDGMGCIHPIQIRPIHDYFASDEQEIEKAKKIVAAYIEATEKGLEVVSLGTKVIEPPVVKRAQKTIKQAIELGKLSKEWRNEDNE